MSYPYGLNQRIRKISVTVTNPATTSEMVDVGGGAVVAIRCASTNKATAINILASHDANDTALAVRDEDGNAITLVGVDVTARWWRCDPLWTAGAQKVGLSVNVSPAAAAVYDIFVRDV